VIVVDTNLVVYLLVASDFTAQAEQVYQKDAQWAAPPLWRSEFRSAMTTFVRGGDLALEDAIEKMEAAEFLMEGQDFRMDSARILRLAAQSGCSAYDSEFVALAEDLRVPLITADHEVLAKFRPIARSMQEFCA
jgi:predicted nucleic acid-binding protein